MSADLSAMQSQPQEKRFDPGLQVNLPTNNPFRKGGSPMNSPPLRTPPETQNVNNPFLDPDLLGASPPKPVRSPPRGPPDAAMRSLNLGDRKPGPPPAGLRRPIDGSSLEGPPAPGQAATRLLQMKPGQAPPKRPPPGIDPRGPPRERRSDEERKIRSPSEERARRERHERRKKERAEREGGLKDSQGRPVPSSSSKAKRNKGPHLDAIDKLDSTASFLDPFGSGYHVSGPYDATIPKHSRKLAPIDAFAKDSLNMVMGGKIDLDKHHHAQVSNLYGHVDDAANDYTNKASLNTHSGPSSSVLPYSSSYAPSASARQPGTDPYDSARPAATRLDSYDPSAIVEEVHGNETEGLGTSTFLEGAPAPASAIRRESESQEAAMAAGGGLSRTRSLAQRLKGRSGAREHSSSVSASLGGSEPQHRVGTTSPGLNKSMGGGALGKIKEKNRFDNAYNDAYENKGAAIRATQTQQRKGSVGVAAGGVALEDNGPSFMKQKPMQLTRSVTEGSAGVNPHQRTESSNSLEPENGGMGKSGGGFLGRMKSFRGKKKVREQE